MMRRLLLALALMGVVWVAPSTAAPSANAVAEQLRCVNCGTSLDVSDAPAARQMKDRIAREIAAGMGEQEIIDGFVRDFGRQVLATPPKSGLDLLIGWLIPVGVPLLALLSLPFLVRSWAARRRRQEAEAVGLPLDDADRDLVDRELEHFDG